MTLDECLAAFGKGREVPHRIVEGVVFYELHPMGGTWWVAGKTGRVVTVARHATRQGLFWTVIDGARPILSPDGACFFTALDGALHIAAKAVKAG